LEDDAYLFIILKEGKFVDGDLLYKPCPLLNKGREGYVLIKIVISGSYPYSWLTVIVYDISF